MKRISEFFNRSKSDNGDKDEVLTYSELLRTVPEELMTDIRKNRLFLAKLFLIGFVI